MRISQPDIRHLLYEDDQGHVIGLDEVQLLEPVPQERIPRLRELLNNLDPFIVYQAALILTAWEDDQGLNAIERMIDERVDTIIELAPHRLGGYDNVYDEFANAVEIYGLSRGNPAACRRIYSKLLNLYGPCGFESKLKYALLKSDFKDLLPDVRFAIERAFSLGREYLASQLLPVVAKWAPEQAWTLVPRFMGLKDQIPNPVTNVAEGLRYINSPESRTLLDRLSRSSNKVVSKEARDSLAAIAGQVSRSY